MLAVVPQIAGEPLINLRTAMPARIRAVGDDWVIHLLAAQLALGFIVVAELFSLGLDVRSDAFGPRRWNVLGMLVFFRDADFVS